MQKINLKEKIKDVSCGAAAWLTTGLYMGGQAFATDWLEQQQEVTINPGGTDPNTLITRAITLICAIIAVRGFFTIAQGYGTWSAGRADENQANESKGVNKMIAGIIEVAAPAVIMWLVNT